SGSRNSFINTTLSSGGTYRILAMGFKGTRGGYELTVTVNLEPIICGLNNAEFQNYIGVTNIDDLTTSGTVYSNITSACGHQWGIQADRASSFSISLVGISMVDSMALYDPYLLF
ncbi:MAG TPA: hypothetical protein PLZ51_25230, partial [Aggregatilineales bacterium]|nr:hypothetical protein [Aggregatilineales bacterium]